MVSALTTHTHTHTIEWSGTFWCIASLEQHTFVCPVCGVGCTENTVTRRHHPQQQQRVPLSRTAHTHRIDGSFAQPRGRSDRRRSRGHGRRGRAKDTGGSVPGEFLLLDSFSRMYIDRFNRCRDTAFCVGVRLCNTVCSIARLSADGVSVHVGDSHRTFWPNSFGHVCCVMCCGTCTSLHNSGRVDNNTHNTRAPSWQEFDMIVLSRIVHLV